MESITACARARVRAISTESVSGGIMGASASLSRTDAVGRAIPHDTTATAAKTPMIHLVPFIAKCRKNLQNKQILPTHAKIGLYPVGASAYPALWVIVTSARGVPSER